MLYALVLTPENHEKIPNDPARLVDQLRGLSFLDDTFTLVDREYYFFGQQFYDWVIFLGCLPNIQLRPEAGKVASVDDLAKFCHAFIPPVHDSPVFRAGDFKVKPKCPACRKSFGVDLSAPMPKLLKCGLCGHEAESAGFDWRKEAGWGRYFLEIRGVHPHEAVPEQAMLDWLESETGFAWVWFYLQNRECC